MDTDSTTGTDHQYDVIGLGFGTLFEQVPVGSNGIGSYPGIDKANSIGDMDTVAFRQLNILGKTAVDSLADEPDEVFAEGFPATDAPPAVTAGNIEADTNPITGLAGPHHRPGTPYYATNLMADNTGKATPVARPQIG